MVFLPNCFAVIIYLSFKIQGDVLSNISAKFFVTESIIVIFFLLLFPFHFKSRNNIIKCILFFKALLLGLFISSSFIYFLYKETARFLNVLFLTGQVIKESKSRWGGRIFLMCSLFSIHFLEHTRHPMPVPSTLYSMVDLDIQQTWFFQMCFVT